MTTLALILLAICCILTGSLSTPKPAGWAVVVLAVVALLIVVMGGTGISISTR